MPGALGVLRGFEVVVVCLEFGPSTTVKPIPLKMSSSSANGYWMERSSRRSRWRDGRIKHVALHLNLLLQDLRFSSLNSFLDLVAQVVGELSAPMSG